MPKTGRRKDHRGNGGGGGGGNKKVVDDVEPPQSDDEAVGDGSRSNETQSIMSVGGERHTDEEPEVDESAAVDVLEDKLLEYIEGITQKSVKGRVDSLKALTSALRNKLLVDFLSARKVSVSDSLSRCILKGKTEEQSAAAMCSVLLLLQLGSDDDEVFRSIAPALKTTVTDKSASFQARAACAEALGVLSFLADQEPQEFKDTMTLLEGIFSASYLKGDGSTPNHCLDTTALHSSAMASWNLLMTVAPNSRSSDFIESHLRKLLQVLSSSDVELRITAGEAIALLHELARTHNEDFEADCCIELYESLRRLSTESNKYRAKKDRKQQKSSFRDVLSYVKEDHFSTETIRMNRERLYLDCWTAKTRYNALCHVLGSGMKIHLQGNEFLREIFDLGLPLDTSLPSGSMSKENRRFQQTEAFKARTKNRNKQRDKKTMCGASND